MGEVKSFRDLRVYQKLKELHLEVHRESLQFPKFEMHELGSQSAGHRTQRRLRSPRGGGSRHTNIHIEAVSRAMGEIKETQHHLDVARDKENLSNERFAELDD